MVPLTESQTIEHALFRLVEALKSMAIAIRLPEPPGSEIVKLKRCPVPEPELGTAATAVGMPAATTVKAPSWTHPVLIPISAASPYMFLTPLNGPLKAIAMVKVSVWPVSVRLLAPTEHWLFCKVVAAPIALEFDPNALSHSSAMLPALRSTTM